MTPKSELTKNRIGAVVMGTSWGITFLALVYIKVVADRRLVEREEILNARIELKQCREKEEAVAIQLRKHETLLRSSYSQLEKALSETRMAKEFAQEQSKLAMKK